MLGTVHTHLTRMASWLKNRYNVMILTPMLRFRNTGVSAINRMTQSVQHILSKVRVATQWNKDQLLVQSQILLDLLMKVVLTLVLVTVGVIGLLARIIVHLLHLLASKVKRKEQ